MRRVPLVLAPAAIALAGFVGRGEAAVIDLFVGEVQSVPSVEYFEGGGFTGALRAEPASLLGSLFSKRDLALTWGGRQSLRVSEGELRFDVFEPFIPPPSNWLGYFEVVYSAASPVNFLDGGATALEFELAHSFMAVSERELWWNLRLWADGLRQDVGLRTRLLPEEEPVFLRIPNSEFDRLDLQKFESLEFYRHRLTEGTSLRLLSIRTVPEPAAALLLFLGTLLVGGFSRFVDARGRRRRD